MRKSNVLASLLPSILLVAVTALAAFMTPVSAAPKADFKFTDVKTHTEAFHQYERTIQLTPEQKAIYREALEGLPAPCCQDNTALTCCCPCNHARAWWGLTKHLVVNLGYNAEETRAKIAEWFKFANPSGWPGNTCYTSNGCAKPFKHGGCGGMTAEQLVF